MSTHCQVAEYLQTHLCIQHIATERSIRRFCRQYMCARVPDCELGQAVSLAIDKVFNPWFLKQFFVVRLLCGEWSNMDMNWFVNRQLVLVKLRRMNGISIHLAMSQFFAACRPVYYLPFYWLSRRCLTNWDIEIEIEIWMLLFVTIFSCI